MPEFILCLRTGSRVKPSDGKNRLFLQLQTSEQLTSSLLAELASNRLLSLYGRGGSLDAEHIHPARWNSGTEKWDLHPRELVIEIPPDRPLEALVLARADDVHSVGRGPVRLRDVVRSPMLWYPVSSNSQSTHPRHYPAFRCEPWDSYEDDVMNYLDQQLENRVKADDPREQGTLRLARDTEPQANQMYLTVVCDVVAEVVDAVRHEGFAWPVEFVVAPVAEQRQGIPDFTCISQAPGADRTAHLLTGEGKVVTVFPDNTTRITRESQEVLLGCARQEADYIRQRCHTYGCLTNQHGSFFFKRTGPDQYAITELIPWHRSGCGVIAMWTYITLKQLVAEPWPKGAVMQGPAVGQTCGQPPATVTASGVTGPLTRSKSRSMASGAVAGSSCSTGNMTYAGYPLHRPEALELFDCVLGHGIVGRVTTGSYYGRECVVKIIDTGKQKDLLELMQHEVAIYDQLSHLQGQGIPTLFGYGFIDHGNSFFLAMSEVKSARKPGSELLIGAHNAAEQVLVNIHRAGLLHGDIRPENVLLYEDEDSWQACIIDFGLARCAESEEDLNTELAELKALFHQAGSSEGSDCVEGVVTRLAMGSGIHQTQSS